jgi:hypothetical protein
MKRHGVLEFRNEEEKEASKKILAKAAAISRR